MAERDDRPPAAEPLIRKSFRDSLAEALAAPREGSRPVILPPIMIDRSGSMSPPARDRDLSDRALEEILQKYVNDLTVKPQEQEATMVASTFNTSAEYGQAVATAFRGGMKSRVTAPKTASFGKTWKVS